MKIKLNYLSDPQQRCEDALPEWPMSQSINIPAEDPVEEARIQAAVDKVMEVLEQHQQEINNEIANDRSKKLRYVVSYDGQTDG